MRKIRVLVVEDSLTVRKHLVEVLQEDPLFEVVGEAADGAVAVDMITRLRPDVVSLDLALPTMSGVAVTEEIMAHSPTPILVVSASSNRGDLFNTYDALTAGAVDVLDKPEGSEIDDRWEKDFVSKLKLVVRVKVIAHPRAKLRTRAPLKSSAGVGPMRSTMRQELVAIGASVGGPRALVQVLRELPKDFPLPILAVVHIAAAFTTALAEWMDRESSLRVRWAENGEQVPRPGNGVVLLAPPGKHLVLKGGRMSLSEELERNGYRPSIDVLLESVAQEQGDRALGALLAVTSTDGRAGLRSIKAARGIALVSGDLTTDESIDGEVAALATSGKVLPLDQLSPTLVAIARGEDSGPWGSANKR